MTLANQVLMTSLPLLITMYADRYREIDKLKAFPLNPPDLNLPVEETFDFIIVGGGTAGCVVARRLYDAGYSILIVEEGGDPPPLQMVPSLWWYNNEIPATNFAYLSVPQKKVALFNGGVAHSSGGKMMGGSSNHHATINERGHPLGYDEWASWTGDKSWSYKKLLKFFKKSENYMGSLKMNLNQHGKKGPIDVITSDEWPDPARDVWIKAGLEMGYKLIDSNGPQEVGFTYTQHQQKLGRRVSTYSAYIQPIENVKSRKGKGSLTIHRYSVVSKVLINDEKWATGVLYKRHGITIAARAAKEVIVSAGVYLSPGVLIRSGIGPADELVKAKVKPIAVLPVGYSLMDHVFYNLAPIYLTDNSIRWQFDSNLTFPDVQTYLKKGIGGLSFPSLGEAFFASSRAVKKEKLPTWPDIHTYFISHPVIPNSMDCLIELSRPYSRGRLVQDPNQKPDADLLPPLVNQNFLDDDSDMDTLIEGAKFCLKVIETTNAFKEVGATFPAEIFPACADKTFKSKEFWVCQIKQLAGPGYHAVGTNRMGKTDDPRSVVDSKLRVIGIKGLRVVDASIMPRGPNANIGAAVIMLSEKAASMIIRKYRKKRKPSKF